MTATGSTAPPTSAQDHDAARALVPAAWGGVASLLGAARVLKPGRPFVRLPRAELCWHPDRWPVVVALLVVAGALSAWLGYASVDEETGLLDYWILAGTFLVAYAVASPYAHGRVRAPVALGAVSAGFVLAGLGLGQELPALLGTAAANAASALVVALVYRAGEPERSWQPETTTDAVRAMAASAVGTLAGLVWGAFPPTPFGTSGDVRLDLWNYCWQFSLCVVAMTVVVPLCFRRRPDPLRSPPLWAYPLLVALAVVCARIPEAYPESSLDWLTIVPVIVAGMLLTQRGVCVAVLVVAVDWATVPYSEYTAVDLADLVAPEAMIDLILAFNARLATLIVLHRELTAVQRRTVADAARAEESRRALLEGVVTSIRDAFLVVDEDGYVRRANPAAEEFLEGGVPERLTVEWASTVAPEAEDPADLEDLLARMLDPEDGHEDVGEAVYAGGSEPRRIHLTATRLAGEDRLVLVLWRDITIEHARQQHLEWFAASVAASLRAPLDGLDTDLAAADAGLARGDDATAAAAMEAAQESVARMRQTIEEYLMRAVDRNPTDTVGSDVVLADLADELGRGFASLPDSPTLVVDVPHTVRADAHLVRQLLANVVTAALARQSRDDRVAARPTVTIGSDVLDERYVVVGVRCARTGAASPSGLGAGVDGPLVLPCSQPSGPADAVGDDGGVDDDLGLGVARAIAARHGGWLDVHARPGNTLVRFALPRGRGAAS